MVMLTISWTSMMCLGRATTSSPSTMPNTMASSGYQSPAAGVGECWVVEGGDAAAGAWLGVAGRAVVDEDAAPAQPPPVDGGVGVGEERRPAWLDGQEEAGLRFAVVRRRREVPRDQVVGDGLPGTLGEVRVGRRVDAGEVGERGDEAVQHVGVGGEAHEIGDQPGVSGITRGDEVVELAGGKLADQQFGDDPLEGGCCPGRRSVVDGGRIGVVVARRRGCGRCRRGLASPVGARASGGEHAKDGQADADPHTATVRSALPDHMRRVPDIAEPRRDGPVPDRRSLLVCQKSMRITTRRLVGAAIWCMPASAKMLRLPTCSSPQVISTPGWVTIA